MKLSPWNAFMVIMTLAVLMVKPIWGENITVHDLPKEGILFSHKTTLLMKNGFAEIHIPTNIQSSAQRDDINAAVEVMVKTCKYLKEWDLPEYECKRSLEEVKDKAKLVKQKMMVAERPRETTRSRRSTRQKRNQGAIAWLWKFLIGSNESEEHLKQTATVVQHSSRAFEETEKDLQIRQNVLNKQANELGFAVDKMTGVFQSVDEVKVTLQVQMLKARIISHLGIIERNYEQIMDPHWEEEEMMEAIEKRKKLGVHHDIPALSSQQLRSVSTGKIIYNNDTLELVITVPTVQQHVFEVFDIWTGPKKQNNYGYYGKENSRQSKG